MFLPERYLALSPIFQSAEKCKLSFSHFPDMLVRYNYSAQTFSCSFSNCCYIVSGLASYLHFLDPCSWKHTYLYMFVHVCVYIFTYLQVNLAFLFEVNLMLTSSVMLSFLILMTFETLSDIYYRLSESIFSAFEEN